MLPKYYRFRVVNNSGQTATFDSGALLALRLSPWKFDSDGVLVYGSVITDDLGFGAANTIVDGAGSEGGVQDNTTNLHIGLSGYFKATHDMDAADGNWALYAEGSDDNINWPSDSDDFNADLDLTYVCTLMVDNSGNIKSRARNFDFE